MKRRLEKACATLLCKGCLDVCHRFFHHPRSDHCHTRNWWVRQSRARQGDRSSTRYGHDILAQSQVNPSNGRLRPDQGMPLVRWHRGAMAILMMAASARITKVTVPRHIRETTQDTRHKTSQATNHDVTHPSNDHCIRITQT